jgi:hypothetical protein
MDRAVVYCDADCWRQLQKYNWVVLEDTNSGEPSYVVCGIDSRAFRSMHRESYLIRHGSIPDGLLVDHINRVRTDCRTENLRTCNHSQSTCNRRKPVKRKGAPSTSQFKGVWRKKPRVSSDGTVLAISKPWVCEVHKKDQKKKHTSCHTDEKAAARKYNEIAGEWMGEYAVLNDVSSDDGGGADGEEDQEEVNATTSSSSSSSSA